MISEKTFAQEDRRLGKQVHCHDGVWWVRTAPFYYKPVCEFRPFAPGSARPHPLKALLGYSHQVPDAAQATRSAQWNILQGEDLRTFSLERLRGKRRNLVRAGIRDCRVEFVDPIEPLLEEVRAINISQARKFEQADAYGTFLPSEYYETHAARWREDMRRIFSHAGHRFVGAFVGDRLAAYVDLIQIEDVWMFGAVKSLQEHLPRRPIDALYFTILHLAAQSAECSRVVNGGGADERESLTHFKGEFFLKPVTVPYYTRTRLPLARLRQLRNLAKPRRAGYDAKREEDPAKPCAESQD